MKMVEAADEDEVRRLAYRLAQEKLANRPILGPAPLPRRFDVEQMMDRAWALLADPTPEDGT